LAPYLLRSLFIGSIETILLLPGGGVPTASITAQCSFAVSFRYARKPHQANWDRKPAQFPVSQIVPLQFPRLLIYLVLLQMRLWRSAVTSTSLVNLCFAARWLNRE
jgi:hypothetical protein